MQKLHKKINLEFIKERVDIDDDKKTTKCTLTFNPHLKDFAKLYGHPSDAIIEECPKLCSGLKEALNQETFTITGVSICADGDVYDPKVGIEIARQRARARAEKKYNKWLDAYLYLVDEASKRLSKALYHSDFAMWKNRRFELEI